MSTPASVDYEDRGSLPPQAAALASGMKGIDEELHRLERAMQNADKPPTQAWLDDLFAKFPWLSGFAGVKYDGTILGQQPADSMKDLDFNPLLYEDRKQNSRALRADIQPSPLGPEVMLATPLYDGVDFLGIVVAYFDMRSLVRFSEHPEDMVVLAPSALLWPGKFDFAATPLAGVDWEKTVRESSAGSCTNSNGTFFYLVRYLGNLPLVFAIPEKGDFPEGNGGLEQAAAFFPQEREKMPPPPLPERKPKKEHDASEFARKDDEFDAEVESAQASQGEAVQEAAQTAEKPARTGHSPNEIQPGSRDSVLLRKGQSGRGRQIEERQLEGENVPVERVERPRRAPRRQIVIEEPTEPEPVVESPVKRPSPFGPEEPENVPQERERVRPSPFGPADAADRESVPASAPENDASPASEPPTIHEPASQPEPGPTDSPAEEAASGSGARAPARMPDGRPSPFGPAN